ncbi:MAG: ATP-binding protein [candidate division WOR-3 bacterium]
MIRKLNFSDLDIKLSINEQRDLKDIQRRAYESLEFGLSVKDSYYNIFISAPNWLEIEEQVLKIVEEFAKNEEAPNDWFYVHNFKNPSNPIAISLESEKGDEFLSDIDKLIRNIKNVLKDLFEGESLNKQKEEIVSQYNRKKEDLLNELNKKAQELGFIIQPVQPNVFNIIPILAGEPLTPQKYNALSDEMKAYIDSKRRQLEEFMTNTLREVNKLDRELREKIEEVERSAVKDAIKIYFLELEQKYENYEKITNFLKDMEEDISNNFQIFLMPENQLPPGPLNPFRKYKVNRIVDNKKLQGAPVIYERNPTYYNLIGRIEKEAFMGAFMSDVSNIIAGSLHLANGGYIIINAYELLKDPFAYDVLKRVVKNSEIVIEDIGERFSLFSTKSLRPEPIPFNAKIILIGDSFLYYLLQLYDIDFRKYFNVLVDFETEIEQNEGVGFIIDYIDSFIKEKNLLEFSQIAKLEVIKHLLRFSEDRKKLPLNTKLIKEILIEADYIARKNNLKVVDETIVKQAIKNKAFRHSRIEEKLRELIKRGILIFDFEGEKVGVVNGLSVIMMPEYSFGIPSRITASVGLGKAGIIDIEKETGLGGKIHTKAVLIIGGYIIEKYGREVPISLHARLTFEQNYSGVEGDSASCAELLAILSAISEVPIKQNIAITGSLNQKGEVQPVGGIPEKIEGFYYSLKIMGLLDGKCGVIVPNRNMDNIILNDEVLDAMKEGKFNIWVVDNFDDVIEIATGLKSDEFHNRVLEKLKEFNKKLKDTNSD